MILNEINMWIEKFFQCCDNIGAFFTQLPETIKKGLEPKEFNDNQKTVIANYKKWGKYGWSILPNMPIKDNIFYKDVYSVEEADSLALPYITEDVLNRLFENLDKIESIKKNYLKEAIFCYKERQYLACSMLLFAMIDYYFINKQTGNIKVGLRGIDTKYKVLEDKQMFFLYINLYNIFASLSKYFGNADNFKKSFDLVNRNYIDHGCYVKEVTETDCIKLFILLSNVYVLNDKMLTLINGDDWKTIINCLDRNGT